MSEMYKLKAQQRVWDTLDAQNNLDIIQALLLVLSLGIKVWIYWKKKDEKNYSKS